MLVNLDHVSWHQNGKTLVHDVTLTIREREIITVIGPNGAGKSSLLKLVTGLALPSAGKITRKSGLRIGFMPQRLQFDASFPINVARFLSLTRADAATRNMAIERLNMECLLKTPLRQLSGGELQRVLLARALLNQPHLMVLDEPTQGVDINGQTELYRTIAALRDELGCAIVMVSHDLHMVMAQTDSVICLNKHVCCHGSPESVEQHPEYLQLFGRQAAQDIAVYTHHHDHQHDLHGDVISGHSCDHHPNTSPSNEKGE